MQKLVGVPVWPAGVVAPTAPRPHRTPAVCGTGRHVVVHQLPVGILPVHRDLQQLAVFGLAAHIQADAAVRVRINIISVVIPLHARDRVRRQRVKHLLPVRPVRQHDFEAGLAQLAFFQPVVRLLELGAGGQAECQPGEG